MSILPLEITIVEPDPPFTVRRGTIATAIVHQRPSPLRSACLTTAVIPAGPDLRIAESAHSFEIGLTFPDLLQHAGVADICRLRQEQGFGPCTLHIAWRLLTDDLPIPIYHGLGLTIRVPVPLQDVEVGLAADDAQNSHSAEGHDPEIEEAHSLMARRPIPRRRPSSSTTSYTTSSSSSAPDWRQTVLFLLDGRSVSFSLPWHDSDAMLVHAAQAVDLPMSQVLRVQHISHRPTDFIQMDLQGLLLQRSTEFRPSPHVRIVLLDLELHLAADAQPTPFQRRARWLPYATTRKALFRVLDLAAVHQEHPHRAMSTCGRTMSSSRIVTMFLFIWRMGTMSRFLWVIWRHKKTVPLPTMRLSISLRTQSRTLLATNLDLTWRICIFFKFRWNQ